MNPTAIGKGTARQKEWCIDDRRSRDDFHRAVSLPPLQHPSPEYTALHCYWLEDAEDVAVGIGAVGKDADIGHDHLCHVDAASGDFGALRIIIPPLMPTFSIVTVPFVISSGPGPVITST